MLQQSMNFSRGIKLVKAKIVLTEAAQLARAFYLPQDDLGELHVSHLLERARILTSSNLLGLVAALIIIEMLSQTPLPVIILMTTIVDLIWAIDIQNLGIWMIQMMMMIHGSLWIPMNLETWEWSLLKKVAETFLSLAYFVLNFICM